MHNLYLVMIWCYQMKIKKDAHFYYKEGHYFWAASLKNQSHFRASTKNFCHACSGFSSLKKGVGGGGLIESVNKGLADVKANKNKKK